MTYMPSNSCPLLQAELKSFTWVTMLWRNGNTKTFQELSVIGFELILITRDLNHMVFLLEWWHVGSCTKSGGHFPISNV